METGVLLDPCYQFARVVLGGLQFGVEKQAVRRLRSEPVSGEPSLHGDGAIRALERTGGAAVTCDGIDLEACPRGGVRPENGFKSADLPAQAAARALLGIDHRHRCAQELMGVKPLRAEHELQVGGIDVGVDQNWLSRRQGLMGQVSECRGDARLSCAALAAEHDELLHGLSPALAFSMALRQAVGRELSSAAAGPDCFRLCAKCTMVGRSPRRRGAYSGTMVIKG